MKSPEVTSLQFAVLCAVGASARSGAEVRRLLGKSGHQRSLPSFYDLMARMEDGGLLKGWYEQIEVGGHKVRERRYQLTGSGFEARNYFTKWAASVGGDLDAEVQSS